MSSKVLILGASGFIGRNLSLFLSSQGYSVFGIGHRNTDMHPKPPKNFLESEINEITISKFCPNPDVIINCAGGSSVPLSFSKPFDDFQKTTLSLFESLEYIRKNKLDCLYIYTSSGAVYGNQQGVLSEDSVTDHQVSPYGVYKKVCEQICSMYHQQYGLDITILRLFSVYGCGLTKQLLWDACNKINRGDHSYFGTGEEIRDWIHIHDICQLYLTIIKLNNKGIFCANGGTGVGTKVKDILALIYQRIGNNATPNFTKSQRIGDPNVFIADNTIAKSIGWDTNILPEQGIPEYTEWFRKTYQS